VLTALLVASTVSAEGRSDDTVKIVAKSGFLNDTNSVKPVRGASYEATISKISLSSPKTATVVIYMHGTINPRSRSNCSLWWNDAPPTLTSLTKRENTHIYFLCSKATDPGGGSGRDRGSWIFKRVEEISIVLEQMIDAGVLPGNIFLLGHSAGGWASLMAMPMVDRKFNAAIVFASAFAGPRAESGVYPVWRGEIRPKHVEIMKSFDIVRALVFAYDNDPYNRSSELEFLADTFPGAVRMISYSCNIGLPLTGHLTHLKDCQQAGTTQTIFQYVDEQISD
jgi:predicted alpha/beta hydrolase family esterase